MEESSVTGPLVARCIVCRGDIHSTDVFEIWEGGYYCRRHSLPMLRERAREYAALLREKQEVEEPTS